MKTILELLKLMLSHTKKETAYYGLCGTVIELSCNEEITILEQEKLDDYIDENPPSDYNNSFYPYYWESGIKAPRLRWLKYHINKLK